jgi:hypothetical protein
MSSLIREDLESLTGKLIQGSLTPVVYELLKDSPYKEDILQYKDLISKEVISKVKQPNPVQKTKENQLNEFEQWIMRNAKIIK